MGNNLTAPRIVLLGLVTALVLTVVGIVLLAVLERDVPNILDVLATSCATGLLGLVAKSPSDAPAA